MDRGLTKRFGDFPALKGFDLTVPRGAIFGFLGPNGAGKTTTLRIMTGLARATAGQITIEGVRVGGSQRPPIGYLPDTPSFYNWMTAPEFLRYIADLHAIENPPITELLDRVGLGDVGRRKIGGFSRGMKQRLGLAQGCCRSPPSCCWTSQHPRWTCRAQRGAGHYERPARRVDGLFLDAHPERRKAHLRRVGILHQGELLLQARRDELLSRFAQPVFEIDVAPDDAPGPAALAAQISAQPWAERVTQDGARLRRRARRRQRGVLCCRCWPIALSCASKWSARRLRTSSCG